MEILRYLWRYLSGDTSSEDTLLALCDDVFSLSSLSYIVWAFSSTLLQNMKHFSVYYSLNSPFCNNGTWDESIAAMYCNVVLSSWQRLHAVLSAAQPMAMWWYQAVGWVHRPPTPVRMATTSRGTISETVWNQDQNGLGVNQTVRVSSSRVGCKLCRV